MWAEVVQSDVLWSLHFLPLQMMNYALQIDTEQLFKCWVNKGLVATLEKYTL